MFIYIYYIYHTHTHARTYIEIQVLADGKNHACKINFFKNFHCQNYKRSTFGSFNKTKATC